jgi:hypothetical protein
MNLIDANSVSTTLKSRMAAPISFLTGNVRDATSRRLAIFDDQFSIACCCFAPTPTISDERKHSLTAWQCLHSLVPPRFLTVVLTSPLNRLVYSHCEGCDEIPNTSAMLHAMLFDKVIVKNESHNKKRMNQNLEALKLFIAVKAAFLNGPL